MSDSGLRCVGDRGDKCPYCKLRIGFSGEYPPVCPALTKTAEVKLPVADLRDWFAGQALPAVIAAYFGKVDTGGTSIDRYCADSAYEYADAMLVARGG